MNVFLPTPPTHSTSPKSKIFEGYWELRKEVEGKERAFLGNSRGVWTQMREGESICGVGPESHFLYSKTKS